jgi:hypothetical protein
MESKKFILGSKTILGLLMTAIVIFAPYLGLSFSEQEGILFTQLIDLLLTGFGLGLAGVGRVVADKPLTFTISFGSGN